jgi:hypothetical protein
MNKSNSTCADIEKLLIKNNDEELSKAEHLLLQQHLQNCDQCQNFQRILTNMQSAMQINKDRLIPDPSIRLNIIRQMKKKGDIFSVVWNYLKRALDYRIPVYQGLIGIGTCLLIVVAAHYLPFGYQQDRIESLSDVQFKDVAINQINVLSELTIIEQQKIGINVNEDTLLTKFIVPSM